MPTYLYSCANKDCINEFEEFHSITVKLETCPHCEAAGRGNQPIIRLISGGSGRGIVELTGNDLIQKVKQDAQQMKRDIYKSEKKAANLIGESKFHQNELARSRR